jgi:ADP-ribose pyrophosphatase YjhB (NUDIX family)
MAKHTEVIARGLLLRGSDALLCRDAASGYLYLPGGHVEFAEPAREALRREMLEECALEVRVGPLLLVTEASFGQEGKRHHEVNLVFHVEHGAGPAPEVVSSRESQIAFEWIPLAAVLERDIRPDAVRAWLAAGGRGDDEGAGWASDFDAKAPDPG